MESTENEKKLKDESSLPSTPLPNESVPDVLMKEKLRRTTWSQLSMHPPSTSEDESKDVEELKRTIDTLEKTVEEANLKKNIEVEKVKAEYRIRFATIQREYLVALSTIDKKDEEFHTLFVKERDTFRRLVNLKDRYEETEKMTRNMQEKRKRFETLYEKEKIRNDGLTKELTQIRRELDEERDERRRLATLRDENLRHLNEETSSKETLARRVEDLERERSEHMKTIYGANNDMMKLRQQLSENDIERSQLHAKIRNLEDANSALLADLEIAKTVVTTIPPPAENFERERRPETKCDTLQSVCDKMERRMAVRDGQSPIESEKRLRPAARSTDRPRSSKPSTEARRRPLPHERGFWR